MLFFKKKYNYRHFEVPKPQLKRSVQHISKNPILCSGPKCTIDPRLRPNAARVNHPWIAPQQQRRRNNVYTWEGPMKLTRSPIIGGEKKIRQLFDKFPTKDEIRKIITGWTGEAYVFISKARRSSNNKLDRKNLQVDWAMAAYMRDFSLRAPMMPVKARNPLDHNYQGAPRYLYRGVNWSVPLGKSLMDRSYTSWSTNPQTGARFGLGPSLMGQPSTRVYRIDISTIPRGTPWIWFTGKGARLQNGWNISHIGDRESEVVLPPGTLTMMNSSKIGMMGRRISSVIGNGRATIVDVKFQPDRRATAIWVPPGGRPLKIFK